MVGQRKKKPSSPEEQYNLWHERPVYKKEQSGDFDQASVSPDIARKQKELDSLSQELAAAKKRISRLERQLKKEKVKNDEYEHAFLRKLLIHLPALLLFEVLKAVSLKETRDVIKPLKPTAGMAISTNRSIKELGAVIGLSPTRTDKAMEHLLSAGFVKKRGLGGYDLGQFSTDKKGRVFPMWYRDINNPENIILLFSPKDTLSNYNAERF